MSYFLCLKTRKIFNFFYSESKFCIANSCLFLSISALGAALLPFLFGPSTQTPIATATVPTDPTPYTASSSSTSTASSPNPHGAAPNGQLGTTTKDSTLSTTSTASGSTATSSATGVSSVNYCLASSSSSQQSTEYWLKSQDHTGNARGYAPFIPGNPLYPVYRDVTTYGAKNDGSGNQTSSLQTAIDTDGIGGTRVGKGTTNMPAEVFLPGGVYTLGSTLTLRLGTIVVGDPLNRPIIKASPDFIGTSLVNGQDPSSGHPETVFMVAMHNVVLDTTAIDSSVAFTALQWGVAQGCALSNVDINMPSGPSCGHIGIHLNGGSTIAVTDVVSS